MKTIYHKASSRGHANHGWLNSHHTFSFANYHHPDRMHFGALRVLNDDVVSGGMGFGMHPHRDMEIISIPLEGALEHEDNMGNKGVIRKGEVQVMTAGTGVMHSEKNASATDEVKFLQIWLFPKEQGLTPRYDEQMITDNSKINTFQQILSPNKEEEGAWVNQDAWFYILKSDKDITNTYKINQKGNGVYIFVIEGTAKIGEQILNKRDGFGISETDSFILETQKDAEILLMEVPMKI